jgi:transcription initiation factor TFIIB
LNDKKSKNKLIICETDKCPECGASHLVRDYSRAELVCNKCGFVIEEDIIDQGPEWRAFDSDQQEKKNRVGAPANYTIHDKGLSTVIGWQNRDYYGKYIPPRNRAQLFRLRKWQKIIRISDGTERNLVSALTMLDKLSSSLNLPRLVRETAAMLYRKIASLKICRGRNMECMATAVLYAACRQCNVPRTLREISIIANIPKKEIGKNYRYIGRQIQLRVLPTSPRDYIPRFCSQLKLDNNVKVKTLEIINDAHGKELISGRSPSSVAAASLYIATLLCDVRITQREISIVAGVTEVTIRNRYKELVEKLDIEVMK